MDICGLHFLPCSFTSFICILELTNPREASQRSFICMKELQFVDFGFCLYEPRLFLCFLQSPVWVAPKTASLGFESFETPNNFNLFHSLKSLLVNRISGQTPTPPILWGTFLGGIHPLGFSGGPGRTEPLWPEQHPLSHALMLTSPPPCCILPIALLRLPGGTCPHPQPPRVFVSGFHGNPIKILFIGVSIKNFKRSFLLFYVIL